MLMRSELLSPALYHFGKRSAHTSSVVWHLALSQEVIKKGTGTASWMSSEEEGMNECRQR